ncbi:MAG: DUF4147 domain-containing protein, partial [Anaerolineae bacterium]|nr:DUF4147 domain-containing protein [Anaerolineae bacterium]
MDTKSIRESQQRETILAVLRASLAAVDPGFVVRQHVQCRDGQLLVGDRQYDLSEIGQILLVGGGKAAVPMTAALWD